MLELLLIAVAVYLFKSSLPKAKKTAKKAVSALVDSGDLTVTTLDATNLYASIVIKDINKESVKLLAKREGISFKANKSFLLSIEVADLKRVVKGKTTLTELANTASYTILTTS